MWGTAASTNALYAARQRVFLGFCKADSRTPLPATEPIVARFLEHLINQNRRNGTLEGYPVVIRHLVWGDQIDFKRGK